MVTVGKTAVRVERKLADGGYGSLYVVKSARTGRSAVLKRMLAPSPEMREQLISEARLLTRLSHPNILRCFGASSHTSPEGDATIIHILLELCSGGQLLSRVQSLPTRPPAADLADALVPVCCAVSYMHARDPPIAHRDLKFENVLLAAQARGRRLDPSSVRLADFGSASTRQGAVSRAERPAEEERIERFTTPQYRSPEMVDLYSREPVDERVDIWALGCMLFLALFRCHPFPDGSSLAILSAKLRIPPGAPAYPKPIMFLLRACFLAKPDLRPTAASIARFLAALGGQDAPQNAAEPTRKEPIAPLERLPVPAEASSVLVSDSGASLPPLLTASGVPVLEVAPHALTDANDFDPFAAQEAAAGPEAAAGQAADPAPADDGFDDFEAAFGGDADGGGGGGGGGGDDDFFGSGGGGDGEADDFEAAFAAPQANKDADNDNDGFEATFSPPVQPGPGAAASDEDDFDAVFGSPAAATPGGAAAKDADDEFEASFGAPEPAPAASHHPRSQSATLPTAAATRHARMQSARTQPPPGPRRPLQPQPEADPEPSAPPADPEEDLLGFGAEDGDEEDGDEDLLGAPEPSAPPAEAPGQFGGLPAHVLAYMASGQMAQQRPGWSR